MADRKLRETQATFATIVDQSFTGVYMVALDTTFAYVNSRFAELLGYTQAEMIGRSFLDFVVDSDRARRREKFARMAGGEVHATHAVGAFRRKDGTHLDLLSQSTLGSFEGRPAIVGLLNVGGYAMAWIGIAQPGEDKLVRVAAQAGDIADYLHRVTYIAAAIEPYRPRAWPTRDVASTPATRRRRSPESSGLGVKRTVVVRRETGKEYGVKVFDDNGPRGK